MTSPAAKPLSDYLETIAKMDLFDQDTLVKANELPSPAQQEEALNRYREAKAKLISQIVSEMLNQASGKIIQDAMPAPPAALVQGGYPLLRDTINALALIFFYWEKNPVAGQIAERWAIRFERMIYLKRFLKFLFLFFLGYGVLTAGTRLGRFIFETPSAVPASLLPKTAPVFPNKAAQLAPKTTKVPKGAWPPPSAIRADVISPDFIKLTWRAVGPNAHYNVYSSATPHLTELRKENEHPLKSNVVEWTPETGLDRYWLRVTTLDPEGRESAPSEPIKVIRYRQ